jgi:hypothetical protein
VCVLLGGFRRSVIQVRSGKSGSRLEKVVFEVGSARRRWLKGFCLGKAWMADVACSGPRQRALARRKSGIRSLFVPESGFVRGSLCCRRLGSFVEFRFGVSVLGAGCKAVCSLVSWIGWAWQHRLPYQLRRQVTTSVCRTPLPGSVPSQQCGGAGAVLAGVFLIAVERCSREYAYGRKFVCKVCGNGCGTSDSVDGAYGDARRCHPAMAGRDGCREVNQFSRRGNL